MTRVRRIGRDTFRSLHNRNYRYYFVGQIISVSGTWMQRIAQAWLILDLTNNSGVAIGVEAGLQFLPMLLFGAWGGVVADRFDKRKLLYITQAAAGLLALGLGLIVWADAATVAIVYVFSLLLGFVNALDNPARQTFVMEMVGRDDLPNAVARNSVVMNTSRWSVPAAADYMAELLNLPEITKTVESTRRMEDLALGSLVEASLVNNAGIWVHGLRVTADRGEVTMTGEVITDEDRDVAEEIAAGVPGVRGVVNELRIHPPPLTGM